MILLVLVALLWVAVLAPSAWRRYAERQHVGSIDHFHHQLELLEHAGPKIVNPAYRLHTAFPGGAVSETSAAGAEDTSRPKLVLLRPTDDEGAADIDGEDGCHYERIGVLETPEVTVSDASETRAELASYRRQQARWRTTLMLRGLTGVVLLTALIGAFPGLHPAWIVTGITGLGALGLMGLIGYAREMEAQQRSKRAAAMLHRQWAGADAWQAESDEWTMHEVAATSGYPGAWDEEDLYDEDFDPPQRLAASN